MAKGSLIHLLTVGKKSSQITSNKTTMRNQNINRQQKLGQ